MTFKDLLVTENVEWKHKPTSKHGKWESWSEFYVIVKSSKHMKKNRLNWRGEETWLRPNEKRKTHVLGQIITRRNRESPIISCRNTITRALSSREMMMMKTASPRSRKTYSIVITICQLNSTRLTSPSYQQSSKSAEVTTGRKAMKNIHISQIWTRLISSQQLVWMRVLLSSSKWGKVATKEWTHLRDHPRKKNDTELYEITYTFYSK